MAALFAILVAPVRADPQSVSISQATPGTTNGVQVNNVVPVLGGQYSASLPALGAGSPFYLGLDLRGNLKGSETGSSDPLVGITANGGVGSTCSTAAASTGCVAKNAQGNLYRVYATAVTAPAAQQYLVCINATTVPAANASITAVDFAPFNLVSTAGSTASINFGPGPPSTYASGIACLISTSLTTYTVGTASIINAGVR